jgi:hypothetical protein
MQTYRTDTPFPLIVRFHEKYGELMFRADSPDEVYAIFAKVAKEWLAQGYYEQDRADPQLDLFSAPVLSDYDKVANLLACYDDPSVPHHRFGKPMKRVYAATDLYLFMKERSANEAQYETFSFVSNKELQRAKMFDDLFVGEDWRFIHPEFLTDGELHARRRLYEDNRKAKEAELVSKGIDLEAHDEARWESSRARNYWRRQAEAVREEAELRQKHADALQRDLDKMYKARKQG